MAKQIWAAMVEIDDTSQFGGVSVSSYDDFGRALTLANALLAGAPAGAIKMFVAPEYLFSGHGTTSSGGTTITSLSRSDKHGLYKKIKESSAQHSDILVVPGSIAYSKARGLSKRKYYNVCPIAYGGRIIHKYYKQSNDTYQSADDFKFKDKGSTFRHMGLDFGIEICLDHGKKVLKSTGAAPDVHILISDGFSPSTTGIAAPMGRGVVVFCDMGGQGNGVLPVFANKFNNPNTRAPTRTGERTDPMLGGARVALYTGSAG